jgi:Flp pilus assembly protein TadG
MRPHGGERRRARGDGAVAMIELAIMLPVLTLLVFGTVDLGRAYQLKNELKNAAREGAAYAQVYPDRQVASSGTCQNPANIRFRAQNELSDGGTGFTIQASPPNSSTPGPLTGCETVSGYDPGEEITITASKDFDVITPFVGIITGDPIDVTESVTVVIQG